MSNTYQAPALRGNWPKPDIERVMSTSSAASEALTYYVLVSEFSVYVAEKKIQALVLALTD